MCMCVCARARVCVHMRTRFGIIRGADTRTSLFNFMVRLLTSDCNQHIYSHHDDLEILANNFNYFVIKEIDKIKDWMVTKLLVEAVLNDRNPFHINNPSYELNSPSLALLNSLILPLIPVFNPLPFQNIFIRFFWSFDPCLFSDF